MKIAAYTPLHYGAQYLAYAIRSVIDAIDELHILYTAQGSHGSRTDLPCPETKDELYTIAQHAAGNKLRWHEGDWRDEGSQRMSIHQYAPDVDVLLALDADEIWQPQILEGVLNYAGTVTNSIPPFRVMRVPMVHMWRSFSKMIIDDKAYPGRVIFPRIDAKYGENTWWGKGLIVHAGYAQTPAIVGYKWLIHGHKAERRHDCNWFEDRFLANAQTDCHPVSINYWNPVQVDPWAYLPEWMRQHPFAEMEVIE